MRAIALLPNILLLQVRWLISLVQNPSVHLQPLLPLPKHQQLQPLLEGVKLFLEAAQHFLEVASPWSCPQVAPKSDRPPRWVFSSTTVITVVTTVTSALASLRQPHPTPPPSFPPPPQTSTSPSPPSPTLTMAPSRRSPHPGQFPPWTCQAPPPSPPTTTSPPPPPCCSRRR